MKVLFIFHETGEHSGAWKSGFNLIKGLRSNGVALKILTPNKLEIYNILKEQEFDVESIKIVWYNRRNRTDLRYKLYRVPFEARRIFLSLLWKYKAGKIVKSFKPDIIHTNSSVFYLGYDLSKHFNIPHVWHIREYGLQDFNLDISPTQKRLAEQLSYNICISNCLLKCRGLCDDQHSVVIYNGIKDKASTILVPQKKNYFLYVGSLGVGKGVGDILEAWISYRLRTNDRRYKLLFAGGKDYEVAEWSQFIIKRKLGLEELGVDFIGKRDDVGVLMRNAKALLVASNSEAFGRVTAEAMFEGCLVIGRNTAGTKEQFDNGIEITGSEIGIRFETIDELSIQIEKVANSYDEEMLEMLQRAQGVVNTLYTNDANIKKVRELYNCIIKETTNK